MRGALERGNKARVVARFCCIEEARRGSGNTKTCANQNSATTDRTSPQIAALTTLIMMDRTREFRELVSGQPTRFIHRPIRALDPMYELTSLVNKINKTREYLSENGHHYLGTYSYSVASIELDVEAIESIIRTCEDKISKAEIYADNPTAHVAQHRNIVLKIMRKLLSNLDAQYHHLKTTKIVRNMEKERMDKLEIDSDSVHDDDDNDYDNTSSILDDTAIDTQPSFNSLPEDCEQQSLIAHEHDITLAPTEIQALAMENSHIHDELITMDDEIKLLDKKVVQLSKLQQLFHEKVMEQSADLDILHNNVIKSSVNIVDGNQLIREAMMKNASTRVFILFYIITLGFVILFLDWYNP